MNFNKTLHHILFGWSPFVVIAVTTLAFIAISIYYLSTGVFIIFQNLFYIPIIIACLHYTKRGFAFSIIIACIYFFLIICFTRESSILLEAFVRVLIFVLVAGIVTYLSLAQKRSELSLRQEHDHLEDLVRERTAQLKEEITERKLAEEEIHSLNKDLEKKVSERTSKLMETIAQLKETTVQREEMNRVFLGQDLKMKVLKERITELENRGS